MTNFDQYGKEVQTCVQDFLSRNRDHHNTYTFLLGAVFELIKLYILFREGDKVMEARNSNRRGTNMGSRPKEEHGHQKRGSEDEEMRRVDHDSGRRRRRGERRTLDRSHSRNKRVIEWNKGVIDPVRERGPASQDPQYMVTGGAGPAGTLPLGNRNIAPQSPKTLAHKTPRPLKTLARGRSSSPLFTPQMSSQKSPISHTPRSSPCSTSSSSSTASEPSPSPKVRFRSLRREGSASAFSDSPLDPSVRHGKDDSSKSKAKKKFIITKKSEKSRLLGRFMDIYNEIKAEHDEGKRSKGFIEKKIDDIRGKKKKKKKRDGR